MLIPVSSFNAFDNLEADSYAFYYSLIAKLEFKYSLIPKTLLFCKSNF